MLFASLSLIGRACTVDRARAATSTEDQGLEMNSDMMYKCVILVICNDGMSVVDKSKSISGINNHNNIDGCSICFGNRNNRNTCSLWNGTFPYRVRRQILHVTYIELSIMYFLSILNN